jgi:glucosamine--fructose-6-phosphate aminotransferase (isomerizing)
VVHQLIETPAALNAALNYDDAIAAMAHLIAPARDVLYLGRGQDFLLALEGALKLKEISYIHAEGYAAGEMKHGPIALIDENVPVIVLAPSGPLFEKTVSNMQEVAHAAARSC